MSEEEIIEIIEELMCLYKEQMNCDKYYNEIIERSTRNFKALQGLLDLYNKEKLNTLNLSEQLNKEKEKNKKLEDKIKKAIKEIERRMNLANECIEQEIVIADSDSLNYGRAQAHDVDRVLLMDVVTVADENKIKEILE